MTRDDVSHERFGRVVGLAAAALGVYAAWFYHAAGLTLSHYDAKGHLVVARRVIDSLTPGWKQIGAVWLPLPHLLNLLPVQIDWCYRTGASGVAISIAAFAVVVYAASQIVLRITGSRLAALAASLVVALNPDMLYLQATPMTEPLLLALTTLGVLLLMDWVDDSSARNARRAGLVLAAACLTRYEAWPLTGAAILVACLALWRRGGSFRAALLRGARVAAFPAAAAMAFFVQSRLTVGHWFVTGGFYVPDNPDMGRPFKTVGSIWWASHHLNGYAVVLSAVGGVAFVAVLGLLRRGRASALVALAMAASAVLPWYAFVIGHPFRFRYMVPLVPALAVYAGCAVGLVAHTPGLAPAVGGARRVRAALACILVALFLLETRPFDPEAPMVVEAQLDRQHSVERRRVTTYLQAHRTSGKILVSLASLSHYVQELSQAGFAIRDFVHEGNGDLWTAAVAQPRPHVEWILIEELSEGGDRLAKRASEDGQFLEGFSRVAEGGGAALYRRQPRIDSVP